MRGQVPLRAMTEKARPIYMKRNQLNYGMACHPWALPSVSRCRDMNSEGRGGEGGVGGKEGREGQEGSAVVTEVLSGSSRRRWLFHPCMPNFAAAETGSAAMFTDHRKSPSTKWSEFSETGLPVKAFWCDRSTSRGKHLPLCLWIKPQTLITPNT